MFREGGCNSKRMVEFKSVKTVGNGRDIFQIYKTVLLGTGS